MKTNQITLAFNNLPPRIMEKVCRDAGFNGAREAHDAIQVVIKKRTEAITFLIMAVVFIAQAIYFRTTPAIGMGLFGGVSTIALMVWSMFKCIDLRVSSIHEILWRMESYLGYDVNRDEPYTIIELRSKAVLMARAYKRNAATSELNPNEGITEINQLTTELGIMFDEEIYDKIGDISE